MCWAPGTPVIKTGGEVGAEKGWRDLESYLVHRAGMPCEDASEAQELGGRVGRASRGLLLEALLRPELR